jgi:phosphoribosylformylglycinamidine cyclo-ligase
VPVHALAHITGGGITENLPRVLPDGTAAAIDLSAWERPAVFQWLQEHGRVADAEMLRTFNCGIGMIVCVDTADADRTLKILREAGEAACILGTVVPGSGRPGVRYENNG